jgi:uncharacterized Fe-S cluster-containing radical SAM superfamily protein
VEKLRLSGCEPTLGKDHLISVLRIIMDSKYKLFILETNGVLLGHDYGYVKQLSNFKRKLYVRVSFKGATPEGFTQRTGARGEFYILPFKALKSLFDEGIRARPAAMTDPRVMPGTERDLLIKYLSEIDPSAALEEEKIDIYETTVARMKASRDMRFAEGLEETVSDE